MSITLACGEWLNIDFDKKMRKEKADDMAS